MPASEKPLRDEPSTERLEERALGLAANLVVDPSSRKQAINPFSRLEDNVRVLRDAYLTLADDVRTGAFVESAAEWLLDNFHVISSESCNIRQNLSRAQFRRLPTLASRGRVRHARVYAVALELIRYSDSRLDRQQMQQFLNSFQRISPMTLGELWAWPSMVRLALIENLRRLVEELLLARAARRAADEYVENLAPETDVSRLPRAADPAFIVQLLHRVREYGPRLAAIRATVDAELELGRATAEDTIRGEHQREGIAKVSVANAVTSLSLSASIDWQEFVESVSLVDNVLRRDPAGIYGRMDFLSREQQRRAVEELAPSYGEDQIRIALKVAELARVAAATGSNSAREAHVGYHLIDQGRLDLEDELAYRRGATRRIRRFLSRQASGLYIGAIGTATASLVAAVVAYAAQAGATRAALFAIALLALLPAIELAVAWVHYGVFRTIRPKRLPRIDFAKGIPDRTMVIVPTVLTSPAAVDALIEHVEVLALSNPDPNIHFAILSDFADSSTPEAARDEAILQRARSGIDALNRKSSVVRPDRFFLFHRDRRWSVHDQAWIGRERKRGQIEEFNRLLRAATDTEFSTQIGRLELLASVRYCVIVNSGTRLPSDVVMRLVGIIAHPLNRPHVDHQLRRVTAGYAILQPHVSVAMASPTESWFARTGASKQAASPYSAAASDVSQTLIEEGTFAGTGLYDVDALNYLLDSRVPENVPLSHACFEVLYARTAVVTDVDFVDDHSTSVLDYARRQRDGICAEWQLMLWLLRLGPFRERLRGGHLPLLVRWKVLDDLRRSLLPPATFLLLATGWAVLPGHPIAWTAGALVTLAFSSFSVASSSVLAPRLRFRWNTLHETAGDRKAAARHFALQFVLLAYIACERLQTIAGSLFRLRSTHRGQQDCKTTDDAAPRNSQAQLRSFLNGMKGSPLLAFATLGLVAVTRPTAVPIAAPILALWALCPWIAFALSRPRLSRAAALTTPDKEYLQAIARRTWAYFDTFLGADDHFLPPNSVNIKPSLDTVSVRSIEEATDTGLGANVLAIAHRTSPTDIGLGLLAILAAHDLGLIEDSELERRIDGALTTIERLERYQGHVLNCYDTRTLAPLPGAFVSTVDSGNLAAALLTLSVGLRDLAPSLGARAAAIFDSTDFRLLFDPKRQLFATGYRLPDADGAGRLEASYHELLASEARLTSFIAIAKGDVPATHWFHLRRLTASVRGVPILLSWSATLLEYLMPLLVMRTYPDTLLDQSCQLAIREQINHAAASGVPWGFSESTCNVVDRDGNYEYKTFGVPGLGLKRGVGDELVVAPHATVLAMVIDPVASTANLRRLAATGLVGDYGFFDAIDYTRKQADANARGDRLPSGVVVPTFVGNHAAMTLVSLSNTLRGERMVERFHEEPRVKAAELLLQERAPRDWTTVEPRPPHEMPAVSPTASVAVRRYHSAHTLFPHTQFLSNGNYVTSLTNGGGGATVWRGMPVTRWRRDSTRDADGQFIYLRDIRSGKVWSATYQPTRREPDEYEVTFSADQVSFRRRDDFVSTQLDVAVSSEDDVEVRRLTVSNLGGRVLELDVTSYAEIVLTSAAEDLAHPALGKLFMETEFLPPDGALLCHVRPRKPGETGAWVFHVLSLDGPAHGPLEWDTDRARFLGRGRNLTTPLALDGRPLTGTTGPLVDPIVSLRQRIRLLPGASARLSFATGIASDRAICQALARKYREPSAAGRTFALALTHTESARRHLDVSADDALLFERLASLVLGTDGTLRTSATTIASNELGRPDLLPHGIGGGLPILLLRADGGSVPLVRQVLQAQEYWRLKGLNADVVILDDFSSGPSESQAQLKALLQDARWSAWKGRTGGMYLIQADQIEQSERVLLESVAAVVLRSHHGDLRAQLAQPEAVPRPAVPLVPISSPQDDLTAAVSMPPMTLANGLGGFVDDTRAYAIVLNGDEETPMPWANVIANEQFGTVVTASGSAHTWSGNSFENRLTPFGNDPISDPTSEALFIRDDETGQSWSPTPGPIRRQPASRYLVRHSAGLTHFSCTTHGIEHELDVFVDVDDPVKFSLLTLTNSGPAARSISVFAYNEWALGPPRDTDRREIITEVDLSRGAVFATNSYTRISARAVAFAFASDTPTSCTTDRRAFIGRNGDLSEPLALTEALLSSGPNTSLDPCAALHVRCALLPGESRQFLFLLGEGVDRRHANHLIARHGDINAALAARSRVRTAWDTLLNAIQVRTPDDSFDALMNRWLLYQAVSCRLWTRGGYYQPVGAFTFRDQLQDVMALSFARPDLIRAHLIRAAARQFVEGDVQHWWYEPTGGGLRTRCSDDMLWLPYAVSSYVFATGDTTVLNERVPYLTAPLLPTDQQEAYVRAEASGEDGTLFDHCLRAIDRGITSGPHGLPLFGSGDWNDQMSRVGHEGRGESTWLGFFLYRVLIDFAPLCDAQNDDALATKYREIAGHLGRWLEAAWDGKWYRRGYYDDGTPLGSAQNDECSIDSIAQTWAVLSGAVAPQFAERAMDAVRTACMAPEDQLMVSLAPPFEHSNQDPGPIKAFPPGVRENGGQSTEAAIWAVMALAELRKGDEAAELFHMLNPLNHTRNAAEVHRYKAEPYVVADDLYARGPNLGRGGWSWYTGAASLMYRAGLETMLGLRRHGETFTVDPCIPSSWPEYEIAWRLQRTRYLISISNPEGLCRGVVRASLDDVVVDPAAIPLVHDGRTHHVRIVLGTGSIVSAETELDRGVLSSAGKRQEEALQLTLLIARDSADTNDLTRLPLLLEGLPEGDRGFLSQTHTVKETATPISSAQAQLNAITRPFLRESLAQNVVAAIRAFLTIVRGLDEPLATEFRRAADRWLELADEQLVAIRTLVQRVPTVQVFRAGEPARCVDDAFVARVNVTSEVERILTRRTGARCVVLYGRRRVGKSTVLINLSTMLPSRIRVADITMEDARAFSSLDGFLDVLSGAITKALAPARELGSPVGLAEFQRFLDRADARLAATSERLCIAIDEYEFLDAKMHEGILPVGLLAAFRTSIQAHQHIAWILAGSHDVSELTGAPWASYLISARTVEVPLFTLDETRALLIDPLRHSALWDRDKEKRPRLDPSFWGDGGIERIHDTTAGWPNFVQLLAQILVDAANDRGARMLLPADYEAATRRAIVDSGTALLEIVRRECRLAGEWDYLSGFRRSDELPLPDSVDLQRSLERRQLVVVEGDRCRMRVPLFQLWLRERG